MRKIMLNLIRFYQAGISPLLGARCRFYPTCSHYTAEAIQTHGAAKGSWLGVKRIVKCHPLNPGGVDLVPEPAGNTTTATSKNTLIEGEQAHG